MRGHSLVEVLVTAALFAALLVVLAFLYSTQVRAQRHQDPISEANRANVLAMEKLRAELRDARVLGQPRAAATLTYQVPLQVGPAGLEWSDTRTLSLVGGALERAEPGQPVQRLAYLGPDAVLTFDRPAGALDQLEVRLNSLSATLPLYNQH